MTDADGKEFAKAFDDGLSSDTLPKRPATPQSIAYQDGDKATHVGDVTLYLTDAPIRAPA